MKAGYLAIAAAMLLAGSLVSEDAKAGNRWVQSALACTSAERISTNDATCIEVWWDNTPPASSGVAGGSTYGARSFCSDYGTVKVHIDIKNGPDEHFILDESASISGEDDVKDVRAMTCCRPKSDLCTKQEAKVSVATGEIMVWNSTDSDYDLVDVSSHMERYEYCQDDDNSDSIFCTANVSGDVNTEPTYSCGTANCTASDCQSEWEKSDSADESFGCNVVDDGFWIRHTEDNDAICTVRLANCTMIPNTLVSFHTPHAYADLSKLIFCSKVVDDDFTDVLLATGCPSDFTEVEIEIEP